MAKTMVKVNKGLQSKVDEYIAIHHQAKQLERKMKALRAEIELFMTSNNVSFIPQSEGMGAINYAPQNRAVMNARYTSYEADDLLKVASARDVAECLVDRVDAEMVQKLITLNCLPKEVEGLKIYNSSYTFSVKA